MRRIPNLPLWLGHAGDLRDLRSILSAGIEAVVELAAEELSPVLTRDLVFCRFPLIDGGGNAEWMIRRAVETVAGLIASEVPTLVACGAGMSRSPIIAAAAVSQVRGEPLDVVLTRMLDGAPADVSADLLADVRRLLGG